MAPLSVEEVLSKLEAHEAVCAYRYKELKDALDRLQGFAAKAIFAIMGGMAVVIGYLLYFFVLPHIK